ncbi:hypothetical protein HAX54_026966, partial [Datura stramonium]|nr:hypothetical protein [Datura stramonium]
YPKARSSYWPGLIVKKESKRPLDKGFRFRVCFRFFRRATDLPLGTVGSLRPTFVPARRVGLAVKLPSAFALEGQSPSGPRKPLHAPVTFWEAYAL